MGGEVNNQIQKSPQPNKSDHNWSFFFLSLIFFAAIILDQLVKHLAATQFLNYNFAFSLPIPELLMYGIYILAVSGMLYYVMKNYQSFPFYLGLAWALIFAGAASNIFERIYLGYVRDFIYFSFYKWTGIYNLADFYIILGILILLFAPAKKPQNFTA
jgi:lipoprotein signal peptidase